MNFILDIVLAVILVLFFLRGWKNGFVSELVDLVGALAALIGAMLFGGVLADWVYATFMRAPLTERIAAELVSGNPGVNEIAAVLNTFPAFIRRMLEGSDITAQSMATGLDGSTDSAVALADAISPVIIVVLKLFFVILLFIALMLAVRVLSRMLRVLFSIPLIRQVNELLGGGMGLIKGLLVVWMVCAVLNVSVPLLKNSAREHLENNIHNSMIFELVYEHNPIYSLLK